MFLNDLPIARKLGIAFAILVLMFAGIGAVLFTKLEAVRHASMDKEAAGVVMDQAEVIMTNILEEQSAIRAYALLRKDDFLKTYQEHRAALRTAADLFRKRNVQSEQTQRLDALLGAVAVLETKLERIAALSRNPATLEEARRLAGVKQLDDIRRVMREIKSAQGEYDAAASRLELKDQSEARLALFGGGALGIAFAILCGWLLARAIATPIRQMTDAMRTLASGNNDVAVPASDRRDEIGSMAQAVQVFREAAIAKEQADVAKRAADAEQQRVVASLSEGLDKLARGDLTGTITADFSPSYGVVKANFNAALDSLTTLISAVAESASSIRTGSNEIAQASEDLARRTESNAASLEQTSAAITQMEGRLKATAEAATQTVHRADDAIATVSDGRETAEDAVQAMARVSAGAKGIDSVIEGLDKIAFQTRVLAMNAAVEAGRAGEAGRGFAVVADLVSALAMRSEEEAGRAREQLTTTQADIISAVDAVQRVDTALANISGGVGEVHALLGRMAADNQAQSSTIVQISAAVGTMDHSTQQNAAMVEQTSAAARNLTSEVAALSNQAGAFTVGTRASRSVAQRPSKPLSAAAVAALTRPAEDWAAF